MRHSTSSPAAVGGSVGAVGWLAPSLLSDRRAAAERALVAETTQVVIFVKSAQRANELNKLLIECNFPSICMHRNMTQARAPPCFPP